MPYPDSAYICTFCKKCYASQDHAAKCQVKCAAAQKPAKSPAYACSICGRTFHMEISAHFHELRHPKALRRHAADGAA